MCTEASRAHILLLATLICCASTVASPVTSLSRGTLSVHSTIMAVSSVVSISCSNVFSVCVCIVGCFFCCLLVGVAVCC